jgi:arylsulfatase A-like enzyme
MGQHQGHCPIRNNQFDKAMPDEHTLGTVLKQAGYHTMAIGKWGLQGKAPDWPGHPMKHGFDEFFGFLEHVSGHVYYHDDKHPLRDGYDDVTAKYSDVYSTDLFTARAKRYIVDRTSEKAGEPFFLYLAYTAIHNALQVPDSPYPAGYGKAGGMQWPVTPVPAMKDKWLFPDYANAAGWTDPMKRYATMARRLDDGVGDVLQLLKDLKIDQDTLVVFSSDNGPANEGGGDPRFFDSWGPFDGLKRDCWEGGVREPTIAWWPGHVKSNVVNDHVSGFWDWMPTFAEVAGVVPPAKTDGVSLMPTLTGRGTQRDRGFVYGEYFVNAKNAASEDVFARKHVTGRGQQQLVRIGDLVGVRVQIKKPEDPLRLYDVMKDPHEDHELTNDPKYADVLARMRELLVAARRPAAEAPRPYDAVPLPATNGQPGNGGHLKTTVYEGSWPWMPDLDALTPGITRMSEGLQTADKSGVAYRFTGFVHAPADGEYTIALTSDGGAELWLHESHLIDDDFKRSGQSVSAKVLLAAGWHPIKLFYRHEKGEPKLELKWAVPGQAEAVLPATAFAAGD